MANPNYLVQWEQRLVGYFTQADLSAESSASSNTAGKNLENISLEVVPRARFLVSPRASCSFWRCWLCTSEDPHLLTMVLMPNFLDKKLSSINCL